MNMRCDQVPLIELLGSQLESSRTEQALAHIEGCPACRERLQTMAAVKALHDSDLVPVHSRLRFRALAASLLIALLIPVFFLIRHPDSEAESLASLATRDKHPYFPLQTRSDTSRSLPENRRRAFAAYSANHFKEATEGFQRLPAGADVLFYSGVSHYLLEEFSPALERLEQAVALDRRWESAAWWYEANTYLKTSQKEKAEAKLKELINSDGSEYEAEALQLLGELEKWK